MSLRKGQFDLNVKPAWFGGKEVGNFSGRQYWGMYSSRLFTQEFKTNEKHKNSTTKTKLSIGLEEEGKPYTL